MSHAHTIRSSCRYLDGRRLWFGQAVMSPHAVQVSGWLGFRYTARRIPFKDVVEVSGRLRFRNCNLAFDMADGIAMAIEVAAPGLWRIEAKHRIQALHRDLRGRGEARADEFAAEGPAEQIDPGGAMPVARLSRASEQAALPVAVSPDHAWPSPWAVWGAPPPDGDETTVADVAPDVTDLVAEWMAQTSAEGLGPALSVEPPPGRHPGRPARQISPEWLPIRFIGAEGRAPQRWLSLEELTSERS